MSLITYPSKALCTSFSQQFGVEPKVTLLTDLSQEDVNKLGRLNFQNFDLVFDNIGCDAVGENLREVYYYCDLTQHAQFCQQVSKHLSVECIEARLSVCTTDEDYEQFANRLCQIYGCPTVTVATNNLYAANGCELTKVAREWANAWGTKVTAPTVLPAPAQAELDLTLKTGRRPGYYMLKSKCQLQPVKSEYKKRTKKFNSTIKGNTMVCVEEFKGNRAFISHPSRGWLINGNLQPMFKRSVPCDVFELTRDLELRQWDKHLKTNTVYRFEKGQEVRVMRFKGETEQKINRGQAQVIVVTEHDTVYHGKIDLWTKVGTKYVLNIKAQEGKTYADNQLTVAKFGAFEQNSDVASVCSFQSYTTDLTSTTNCSSVSSNVTESRPATLSTYTRWGEPGLYQPVGQRLAVWKTKACKDLHDEVEELKRFNVFEIDEFGTSWCEALKRNVPVAKIYGPVEEGYVRFDSALVTTYCDNKFKAGPILLGNLHCEVVDAKGNFITELPSYSKVVLKDVVGRYAQITSPVRGYIHLAQALLNKRKPKLSVFFTDAPKGLNKYTLSNLLGKAGFNVKVRDINSVENFNKTRTFFVNVNNRELGENMIKANISFDKVNLSSQWTRSSKATLDCY